MRALLVVVLALLFVPTAAEAAVSVKELSITQSGNSVTAKYTVEATTRTYLSNLVVATRNTSGANLDFGHRTGITLEANAPRSFSATGTRPDGSYRSWIAYRQSSWTNLLPRSTFTLPAAATPPPPPDPPPEPEPAPAPQPEPTAPTTPPGGPWSLAFSDEFDGSSLNTTKWAAKYARSGQMAYANPGNGEAQWYKAENCVVQNGALEMTARREATVSPFTGTTFPYSSCIVTSKPSYNFTYGYMEARMWLPKGSGFWPAFWTWPTNEQWPPEIDVMEFYGDNPTLTHHTYHGSGGASGSRVSSPDWTTGWHTFAVDWQPNKLDWYVDGRLVKSWGASPTLSKYLIANLAICSGSRCPAPNSATPFPATAKVDYIRVWRR